MKGVSVVEGVEVRVGTQGRIVLPREIRDQLGAEEGAIYVARVEDDMLVLESRKRILARLRAHARSSDADDSSWVDELLAERATQAKLEAADQ